MCRIYIYSGPRCSPTDEAINLIEFRIVLKESQSASVNATTDE